MVVCVCFPLGDILSHFKICQGLSMQAFTAFREGGQLVCVMARIIFKSF